ncbi:Transcriptional regulator, GntR family [Cupriavidus taiwanensis]|uniref:Transcriptional regulator, GntR family n=1 Tax=Cupriavidus taiwanensis TaxID=164546 RepID=A0A375HB39_9BURK|nr:GntR family transcriptional regulator [Cupriavidus taiwanensis]SOZ73619.1 Transcriptional regulator, GntR family [Cupriavidus taiwanensis]SOZ73984.1 Transcriptional regulator, GntR family [Cupriavidus taiwanensis]SOZ75439.1 Transcriptional regulator, GntR family [Cupriavidus taiwanensis]SPA03779.1 Transcriptional regulator, GntR family [Cupriavidus taiwanensis]SPA12606.1 Transcriptional regulator, GntR family [Cupriavidus taiwanensis]
MSADLTLGQKKAVQAIVAYVRREGLMAGHHLPEWGLAKLIGTSRSPIRVALEHLTQLGVVRYDKHKGYSLVANATDIPIETLDEVAVADDAVYLRLADAYFGGEVAGSMKEADLIRLLNVTRPELRRALQRAETEGWTEKETGYGWEFTASVNSLEGYEDLYALRIAIEPAGILSPKFRPDLAELDELRKEQLSIVSGLHRTLTPIERFESNANFHATIAKWSGNKLAIQILRRLDKMRRVVEYQQSRRQLPRVELAQEHLAILDAIEGGDFISAASLLRNHLDNSRRKKAVPSAFRTEQKANESTAEPTETVG